MATGTPHPQPGQTEITPLDALWQAPVIIWVVMVGEGLAAILAMAPAVAIDRWIYFGLGSLAIQWVLLLTLGGLYLLRRWLTTRRPVEIALLALTLLIVATWLICAVAWFVLGDYWYLGRNDWPGVFIRFTGIALALGLIGLAAFQNHWRKQQLAIRAKQAELEALQARIRPHFLFNTLNTGIALVHAEPRQAERLLLDLSDLFRAALAGPSEVSLAEELGLAQRYLEIESLRFGHRLDIRWELPEDPSLIPAASLPALSIQPLVENAIKHGIEPDVSGGYVLVGLHVDGGEARVIVRNSLPANAPMFSGGHRVGLSAVRARIEASTGGKGRLHTRIEGDEHVAELSFPLRR